MKKCILILIISLLMPFNVLAYSDYIYVGGENIGIRIDSKKVLVVGFYLKNNNDIKIGDYIIEVNNNPITNINELVTYIEKYKKDNIVSLTIERNSLTKEIEFKLIKENNKYKTGLYVKDSITGIGTLTYIDPESSIYGALGHEIIESNSGKSIEVKTGKISSSQITNIDKSRDGNPGSKNANILNDNLGSINKNTTYGIYGSYTHIINENYLEVGKPEDLKKGLAYIRTVLDDNIIKEYKIEITKIDIKHNIKNIYFKIVDEELLNKTGGIVQGMSGSPIIQNNKIFGAVTHVVVDNVEKGYGIFITTMLSEGDKIKK